VTAMPEPAAPRVGPLRRLVRWLVDQLPGPPEEHAPGDPLLSGLEALPPDERAARMSSWGARFRRGRGDGNG